MKRGIGLAMGLGLCLLLPAPGLAQTYEDIFEQFENAEAPELAEILRQMVDKPIRINAVPRDSLAHIWFLDANQIDALLALHKRKAPHITNADLAETLNIPGELVAILFADDQPVAWGYDFRSRYRQRQQGGQQDLRLRIRSDRVAAGIITEKDAGERRFDDFLAGYVAARLTGERLQVLAGDFTLQAATGLVFAGSYGHSALTVSNQAIPFSEPRILPHRTTSENIAFRGVAARWHDRRVTALVHVSRARRDAVLNAQNIVTSIPLSGYHRTASEQRARDQLLEQNLGAIVNLAPLPGMQIGVSYFTERFSHSIAPQDLARQHFAFRGDRRAVAGAFARYASPDRTFSLFSEWADCGGEPAWVLAGRVQGKAGSLHAAFWHAAPGFQNSHGALPGETLGETANQAAFYLGLTHRSRLGKINLAVLRSVTPWRTYRLPLPSQRQEIGLQWERRLARRLLAFLRLRYRRLPDLAFSDAYAQQRAGRVLVQGEQLSLRLQFQVRISPQATYRVRFDGVRLNTPGSPRETGLAQAHELIWRPAKDMTAGLRYSFYRTDSYASRVYQFEPYLPGLIQTVALYGTGQRLFAYFRQRIRQRLLLAVYMTNQAGLGRKSDWQFGVLLQIW